MTNDKDTTEIAQKSIFISYSWGNEQLKEWVREVLATRLMNDGVEVKLDVWDFKEGHDKFKFMESMVNDPAIDKVLVICDRYYAEKANSRKGGVGEETQIITPHVYQSATQEKFIPIICEYDEENQPYLPTYLKTRKYFDLSSDDNYLENYIQLLRFIFDRPEHRKPKLGTPPSFLFENKQNEHKLNFQTQLISQQASKGNHDAAQISVNEYKKILIEELYSDAFKVNQTSGSIYQEIENSIDNTLQLKESFNKYIITCLNYNLINTDFLVTLLEDINNEIIRVKEKIANGKSYYDFQFDSLWFFLHELFLNLTTILMKKEKFGILGEILHSRYLVYRDFSANPKEYSSYQCFYSYIRSFEEQKSRFNIGQYSSPTANKILTRINHDEFSANDIIDMDLILNSVSILSGDDFLFKWYPVLKNSKGFGKIEIFQRMVSERHCMKVKEIFGAGSIDELKEKINKLSELKLSQDGEAKSLFINVEQHVELDKIATAR